MHKFVSDKGLILGDIKELISKIAKLTQQKNDLNFKPVEYNKLDKRADAFRKKKIVEAFSKSKTEIERIPGTQEDLSSLRENLTGLETRKAGVTEDIRKYGRIEIRYGAAKTKFDEAQKLFSANENQLSAERSKEKEKTEHLKDLKEKKKMLRANLKKIQTLSEEKIVLEDLRNIFRNIPENILRRLRPFIEKEGADILNELSNGEITALNIEEQSLNVAATKNGVVRPIHYFSGGQKTRINMALRVAVSRILSKLPQTEEHTFATMQTMFIDEGDFGDLDESGIREVVNVIKNLTKEFDRVILISHIPAIKEIFQGYTIDVQKTGEFVSTITAPPISATALGEVEAQASE